MAVADKPIDVDKLAEDYEAEKPGRRLGPIHEKIVQVACAGLSLLRDLLGAQPRPRAALPHELPRRRARADVPRLPRLGQARGGRRTARAARDHRLAARARLGRGARLHARDLRRVRAPRRAAQRPRHRLRRRDDPARAGGDAPHGRLDPARGRGRRSCSTPTSGASCRRRGRSRTRATACRGSSARPTWGCQGIFGVPLDVAATYIVLFTLYGAVLEYSGAGNFFLDISLAATGRSRTGPGRTTALAGFLLGTVSGSGVATTVTLGTVTWPILRRGRLSQGGGRRRARRLGHRRDPVAADARRRRVHHRRVPQGLLPHGAALRGDPVAPLLPRDPARDRGRRAPLRHRGGRRRVAAVQAPAAALRLPLLVAVRDRRAARGRALAVPRGALRDRARVPALVPRPAAPDGAGAGVRGARRGRAGGAAGGRDLRRGGDHRRGRHAHRPRPQPVGDHRRRRRRQPVPVRAAGRDRGAAARPRGAGHGLVHHRRGDRVAGADQARRRAAGGLHVHLLLRGPVRGEPADRAVGLRRRGDHRRQRLPHDDADLEVHAAGLPRPVRVRADRQRRGAAAAGLGRDGPARLRRLRARGGGRSRWRPARGCSGPRGCPSGVLCGAAGLVLLYLEPLWIGIGLGLFALGVAVHLVGRRQVPSGLRSAEG